MNVCRVVWVVLSLSPNLMSKEGLSFELCKFSSKIHGFFTIYFYKYVIVVQFLGLLDFSNSNFSIIVNSCFKPYVNSFKRDRCKKIISFCLAISF